MLIGLVRRKYLCYYRSSITLCYDNVNKFCFLLTLLSIDKAKCKMQNALGQSACKPEAVNPIAHACC